MRKKRLLFHSDFALAKTGFGRVMKTLLTYLYKTGKYEIHHVCCGVHEGTKELESTPWSSYGAAPADQATLQEIAKDPNGLRMAGYGSFTIDQYVRKIKPDVYIGAQDFWGLDYSIEKNWFKKVNSCLWITLDSLPLLPSAVKKASHIKNYWMWSNFAEKEFKRLGHNHVETIHGPIEASNFFRLSDKKRTSLRKANNLPEDSFIIGFVFRNQLRKLVPNLMEGYKMWKDSHPEIKNTYLLLHTNFSEGWNIKAQAEQYGICTKEILTTYICKNCGNYEVKTFDDRDSIFELNEDGTFKLDNAGQKVEKNLDPQNKDCKFCLSKGSQTTTGVGLGVSEEQLNEVYNFMDVYVHPFTSGGQEIPIQEAKLTELTTLITNYSCGEECCEPDAYSFPLEWSKYLEHGTEFIKASTKPESIKEQLDRFISLSNKEKRKIGKLARKWALQNFSIEEVGAKIERKIDNFSFLDDTDESNYLSNVQNNPNPDAEVDDNLQDREWLKELYLKILDRKVEYSDEGLLYWMSEISKGTKKADIKNYFKSIAIKELQSRKPDIKIDTLRSQIDETGNKSVLFVLPESAGDIFMATALFESIKDRYPEYDLYVSTKKQFKDILNGNKYVYKWIEYMPEMDNLLLMEGHAKNDGYFDIAYLPHLQTQRLLSYLHNGEDKIDFEIYKK
jgi:glycosyltransferase involved in cell wall biosynthesis